MRMVAGMHLTRSCKSPSDCSRPRLGITVCPSQGYLEKCIEVVEFIERQCGTSAAA